MRRIESDVEGDVGYFEVNMLFTGKPVEPLEKIM